MIPSPWRCSSPSATPFSCDNDQRSGQVVRIGGRTKRSRFASLVRMYFTMFPFVINSETIENVLSFGLMSTAISFRTLGWDTFIQSTDSLQNAWIQHGTLTSDRRSTRDARPYCITHLVGIVNIGLLGYADGSNGDNPAPQSPLSDVRESPARYNFFLDRVSGPSTNQIAFWDLTCVPS